MLNKSGEPLVRSSYLVFLGHFKKTKYTSEWSTDINRSGKGDLDAIVLELWAKVDQIPYVSVENGAQLYVGTH